MFRKMKIGSKVFIVSFVLVLAGVLVASTMAVLVFVDNMEREMDTTLEIASDSLSKEIEVILQNMHAFGEAFSNNRDLAHLMRLRATLALNEMLMPFLTVSGFNTITVTDNDGVVISRPHAQSRVGDNTSNKGYVGPALNGSIAVALEPGTTIGLGLFCGFPVRDKGEQFGVIVPGVNLANPEIVDRLKQLLDAELTLFFGDARINTTLEQDGKRILDSKAAPDVVEVVLRRGEVYYKEITLNDVPLRAVYKPFVFNGEKVGIVSAAVDMTALNEAIAASVRNVLIVAGIFLLLTIPISMIFARSISRPLLRLSSLVGKVEEGDLSIPQAEFSHKSRDEIGQIFRSIGDAISAQGDCILDFKQLAYELADGADGLSALSAESRSSCEKIRQSVNEMARMSEATNQSVQNTTSSLREVSLRSTDVAQAAEEGAKALLTASGQTMESVSRVGAVLADMDNVRLMIRENNDHIQSLGSSISEITGFISVITGIADQTNLLALNAAIEAARAGESGRGFAVVAEEVRKLAEESASAAKRIGEVIQPISQKTRDVMAGISSSVAILQQTMEKADFAKTELAESSESMNRVSASIQNIVSIVQEQSSTIQDISGMTESLSGTMMSFMKRVDLISGEASDTLESSDGVSTTASGLRELSDRLRSELKRFRVREALKQG